MNHPQTPLNYTVISISTGSADVIIMSMSLLYPEQKG